MSFVSHNETQESRNKYDMQHKKTQGITNDLHTYIYIYINSMRVMLLATSSKQIGIYQWEPPIFPLGTYITCNC